MDASVVAQRREDLLHRGTVTAELDGTVHVLAPVAIPAAEGDALRAIVRRERCRRTIEVGLGYGVSALYICEGLLSTGLEDVRHVAVDPHQTSRFSDCGVQILGEAGLRELLGLHREESQIVLPRLLAEGTQFDLAFVDGDHRFDGVFLDLVFLGRLVRPRGVVFVDDYQLPSVEHAVSFCVRNLGWAIEEESRSHEDHNWVVLRTPRVPVERAWNHFVEFGLDGHVDDAWVH